MWTLTQEGTLAARKTAFLPVFRISKRLARAVLEGLGSSTLTGEKEYQQHIIMPKY